MGKRISGYWNEGDKIVSDRVRLNVIAQRMAAEKNEVWRGGTNLKFHEAKQLAMAMLNDFDYREWRTAKINDLAITAPPSPEWPYSLPASTSAAHCQLP